MRRLFLIKILVLALICSAQAIFAQNGLPEPGTPRGFKLPKPAEKTLPNGLRVIVVTTKNVPIVTATYLSKSGGETDPKDMAGLADFTSSLMTKGTKTRTASQIAEEVEFLGGFIGSSAAWDNSSVTTRVTSDKTDKALAILSDVVQNPVFSQEEIDRYREQLVDDLSVRMKQPGTIANYVASRIVFDGLPYSHPISGTPESIAKFTQDAIKKLHLTNFAPRNSVLVFSGDIMPAQAFALAGKWFGKWSPDAPTPNGMGNGDGKAPRPGDGRRVQGITIIDLPNSGQAAVNFAKRSLTRVDKDYYRANVLNTLLGGSYSSRLNQEVRIKRGLSYGASSSFSMRRHSGSFRMSCQTKNESAAEVAELFVTELEKLANSDTTASELTPKKSVLTGDFGRDMATTFGLAGIVGNLATYGVPLSDLDLYMNSVNAVTPTDIRAFARQKLDPLDGVIVIVGDYKLFSADLKKRFGNTPVRIVPADKLDLESSDLIKK